MSSTPFMQLYVGDYLTDTLDLTTEQHGAYLLLLMTMWSQGGSLPSDPKKLARIARVSARRWHVVWQEIEHFFYEIDGVIRNERLDREHKKAVSISEKRIASGAKGGRAKALKTKEPDLASAKAGLKHSQKSESYREKEEPNGSSKKGSRLNAEWRLPQPWGQWAVDQGLPAEVVRREGENFRDYWIGIPGQKGVKLDWQATWRNWIRKRLERMAPEKSQSDFWSGEKVFQ